MLRKRPDFDYRASGIITFCPGVRRLLGMQGRELLLANNPRPAPHGMIEGWQPLRARATCLVDSWPQSGIPVPTVEFFGLACGLPMQLLRGLKSASPKTGGAAMGPIWD